MSIANKLRQIKALLSSDKFSQEPLVDGTLIEYSGDEIAQNAIIYKVEGANNVNVLPDGAYITKAQTNFTITKGVVSAITSKATPVVPTVPVLQAQAAQKKDDGNVEYADKGLQADKEERYPIDTEEHIRAAWNYIHKKENEDKYSAADLKTVMDNIEAAWKKVIDPKGPPSSQEQSADTPITVDVNDVINAALQPLWTAVYDLQNSINNLANLYVSQDNFSKAQVEFSRTKNAINALTETVEVLANEPAAAPIECEATSFASVPKGQKEDRNFKIFHAK